MAKSSIIKARSIRRIVLTNGIFDMVHAGHIEYLRACKALGDILVVGINSDIAARSLKGEGRPIYTAQERATIINAIRWVDKVIIFDDVSAVGLIQKVKPNIYVKGEDYSGSWIPEFEAAEKVGAEVITCGISDDYKDIRTSLVLARILKERDEVEKTTRPIENL